MKKYLIVIPALVMLLVGCNSATSYATLLRKEKKLIANYISRNGIQVTTTLPDDTATWAEKLYYQVPGYDNLYYHEVKKGPRYRVQGEGDTIFYDEVQATERIVMRHIKYTLTEKPDTFNYWSTLYSAYPVEFQYLSDYTNACEAWHVAVALMGYSDSECIIICPSKQGFTADQTSVTPYGYHLKMKIKR